MDNQDEAIVKTTLGEMRGNINESDNGQIYYSFQGIPYAKPPIGKLRFKAPQPADPWRGILNATLEGNKCFSLGMREIKPTGSEDCLFLNIYTPSLPASDMSLKPVMFFIHGGSFTTGSGNMDLYGPDYLMKQDIVLVTINYRLGLLGFSCFDDPSIGVPGNAGLKDQVLALKWVKDNIRNFNGDPDCITVFGESSGAISAHAFMFSPLAKGLFHCVILQSCCLFCDWSMGNKSAPYIAEALNLPSTTEEKDIFQRIKLMNKEDLLKLQNKIPDKFLIGYRRPWGPVVESYDDGCAFLLESPLNLAVTKNYSHVPIIIGYVNNEGLILNIYKLQTSIEFDKCFLDFELSPKYYLENEPHSLKRTREAIKKVYYDEDNVADSNYRLITEYGLLRNIYETIRIHSAVSNTPIYLFRFSVDTKLNLFKNFYKLKEPGACHGDILGYLFKNIYTPKIHPGSVADQTVHRITTLWTTFARTGNPNPVDADDSLMGIEWKPVEKNRFHYLDIGDNLTCGVNPEYCRIKFWDELNRKPLNLNR